MTVKELDLECHKDTYRKENRIHVTIFMDKTMALETIRKLIVGMQDKENKEFQFSAFGKKID